ncbi:MAG: phosphotransferase [Alphaproteobacteria bacterium]|nr:phosphotransferase [Alphaproteobacteria bacterium]
MNRDRLHQLGFELVRDLGGRSQGAWLATASNGSPVILKWSPFKTMANRYATLLPGLNELRARGVPVPEYLHVIPFDGGTLSVQHFLPGKSQDNPSQAVVEATVDSIAAKAGIPGPLPAGNQPTWGAFVVGSLTDSLDGRQMQAPLRSGDKRTAAVLDRIRAVGADADPDRFPDNGLVHLDLHTDNILIDDDALSGIIDWEEACAGDHLYDLVQFAFDLDGHGPPVWDIVDAAGFEPQVLRAYIAYLVLKCASSAILHHPEDMARQLARAKRVLDRYEI